MAREPLTPETNDIVEILSAERVEPAWLVPNFILQGTLVCYAGDAGSGKSLVSYAIALALAAGCEGLGGIIPAGDPKRVLYFDEENSPQDRAEYIRRAYFGMFKDGQEPDLANLQENFYGLPFWIGQPGWEDTVAECIEQVRPHLMVFDTATPCFAIEDENSNSEATRACQTLRRLMHSTNPVATSIVLKHAKLAEQKGVRLMRGAKAWKGATDATFFQVRYPGRPRKDNLRLTRIEPDKTRAFGLQGPIYITPRYTDEERTGMVLNGSWEPSAEHKRGLDEEKEEGA